MKQSLVANTRICFEVSKFDAIHVLHNGIESFGVCACERIFWTLAVHISLACIFSNAFSKPKRNIKSEYKTFNYLYANKEKAKEEEDVEKMDLIA